MKRKCFFSILMGLLFCSLSAKAAIGDDAFTAKTAEGLTMAFHIISEEDKTCGVGAQYLVYGEYILSNVGVLSHDPNSWNEEKGDYDVKYTVDKVTVPAEANGYKVIEIRDMSFYNEPDLTQVVLPEGLQTIGGMAFMGCKKLQTINLPEGLETIGGMAFEGCEKLKDMAFPSTLRVIGGAAFRECDALENVILPEGLTEINAQAFAASGVYKLALPSTLQTIGEGAFSYSRVSQVYALMTNPNDIPLDAFVALDPVTHKPASEIAAALFVSKGMVDTYQALPGWAMFRYIWDHLTYEEWLPTGMDDVKVVPSTSYDCYDLQGRRVLHPTRGMYILNGKKILLK